MICLSPRYTPDLASKTATSPSAFLRYVDTCTPGWVSSPHPNPRNLSYLFFFVTTRVGRGFNQMGTWDLSIRPFFCWGSLALSRINFLWLASSFHSPSLPCSLSFWCYCSSLKTQCSASGINPCIVVLIFSYLFWMTSIYFFLIGQSLFKIFKTCIKPLILHITDMFTKLR